MIASSVVHYELEFIHLFSDGNGRIGRLWQTLILSRWQPMLAYLPVETVIRQRKDDYYRVLGEADRASVCSGLIRKTRKTRPPAFGSPDNSQSTRLAAACATVVS